MGLAKLEKPRPLLRPHLRTAGGRTFNTAGEKVVAIEGTAPPKNAVINEWDSLDQATAYYKSKAWNDLAPQRDKAIDFLFFHD